MAEVMDKLFRGARSWVSHTFPGQFDARMSSIIGRQTVLNYAFAFDEHSIRRVEAMLLRPIEVNRAVLPEPRRLSLVLQFPSLSVSSVGVLRSFGLLRCSQVYCFSPMIWLSRSLVEHMQSLQPEPSWMGLIPYPKT